MARHSEVRETGLRHHDNKENRCAANLPSTVLSSVTTESKRTRVQSKHRVNDSVNYGRALNRSIDKPDKSSQGGHRGLLEQRISRKYKDKFNQSLVSRSREKHSQRSRVNSSIGHPRKDIRNSLLLEEAAGRPPQKRKQPQTSTGLKEPSKTLKARRM